MRTLTDHIVSPDQAVQLKINVLDEPGAGGANHEYAISWPGRPKGAPDDSIVIRFQNGPIKSVGVNGITQEALLAIVIDRLRSFQSGPYACEDNAVALDHARQSLAALQNRTVRRISQGVEGTLAFDPPPDPPDPRKP